MVKLRLSYCTKYNLVVLSEILLSITSYKQMAYAACHEALMACKIFSIFAVIMQKNMKLFLIVPNDVGYHFAVNTCNLMPHLHPKCVSAIMM